MKIIFFCCTFLLGTALSAQRAVVKKIAQGNTYYKNRQFDKAEEQYRAALALEERNGTALFNLSNALYHQKKYAEAAALQRRLGNTTTQKDLQSSAFYNEGVGLTRLKELEAGIAAYRNALRADPSNEHARSNLQKAMFEWKKEQERRARQQKQQKNKMQPKDAEQKLKELEEKEKLLQDRLQKRTNQRGSSMVKDW